MSGLNPFMFPDMASPFAQATAAAVSTMKANPLTTPLLPVASKGSIVETSKSEAGPKRVLIKIPLAKAKTLLTAYQKAQKADGSIDKATLKKALGSDEAVQDALFYGQLAGVLAAEKALKGEKVSDSPADLAALVTEVDFNDLSTKVATLGVLFTQGLLDGSKPGHYDREAIAKFAKQEGGITDSALLEKIRSSDTYALGYLKHALETGDIKPSDLYKAKTEESPEGFLPKNQLKAYGHVAKALTDGTVNTFLEKLATRNVKSLSKTVGDHLSIALSVMTDGFLERGSDLAAVAQQALPPVPVLPVMPDTHSMFGLDINPQQLLDRVSTGTIQSVTHEPNGLALNTTQTLMNWVSRFLSPHP